MGMTFRLAIVGTSHLSEREEIDARNRINWGIDNVMNSLWPDTDLVIITGDADGIDKIAKQIANEKELEVKAYVSSTKSFGGPGGFKERNEYIASNCDGLVCISTDVKTENCYHCNNHVGGHERTGGCWTMKKAKSLGKFTKLVII